MTTPVPFTRSAEVYDAIYANKNYEGEAARVRSLVDPDSNGASWLEIACGTGRHIPFLAPYYSRLVGMDLAASMVELAGSRMPNVDFRVGDMVSFDIGQTFDVVSCLFGSIGYCATTERLNSAVASMARHLNPGRRLVIEPWIFAHQYVPNTTHARYVDTPELKVVRMNTNRIENGCAVLEFHHMVGDANGVEHYSEDHVLGLFEQSDYETAFANAGLKLTVTSDGGPIFIGEKQ
jgi:SAM-dependent methyltransferase